MTFESDTFTASKMYTIDGRRFDGPHINVAVVGGSLSGLMAAITLKSLSCSVQVFEKSSAEPKDSQGAGIVAQTSLIDFMVRHNMLNTITGDEISVRSSGVEHINKEGDVVFRGPRDGQETTWRVLFRHFKKEFPEDKYNAKTKIVRITKEDATYLEDEKGTTHGPFDFVITCDGPDSKIRKQLLPDESRKYVGYVAWRGLVPEKTVQSSHPEIITALCGKIVYYFGSGAHILSYVVPGQTDSLEERDINWVWYTNVNDLTVYGLFNDKYSLARGWVPEELVEKQKIIAEQTLPPVYRDLVQMTEKPFIQAITDLQSSKMFFPEMSAIIMGDAAFGLRPHIAAATQKAAMDAMALEDAVRDWQKNGGDLYDYLKIWEEKQLKVGLVLYEKSVTLGNKFQSMN
jgi:2,6-dihydroxypyridine 3-monooxygenase